MVLIRCVNVKLPPSSNGYVSACCLMTGIVVVLCTGSRHDQICQKYEKVIYEFGIQGFFELPFRCGVKALKFSSYSVLPRAEIQRHCQLPGVITHKLLIG
jgi:hypothetical protein